MPFEVMSPDEWRRAATRCAVIGPPNSWKTTSLLTWPRPIHIVSYPGEHGHTSIPQVEGVHVYVWRDDTNLAPEAIRDQVIAVTMEILSGKRGPIRTFAGDGFHKLYQVFREARFNELKQSFPTTDEDKLGGRAYGEAHLLTYRYFRKVMSSGVPYIVFTMWAQMEKDDKTDKSQNAPSHIWPDLPGELAKNVMGEFALVMYAQAGREVAPGKWLPGTWQTKPAGKVAGAGCKFPPEVAARIPTMLPHQEWSKLEQLILGAPPALTEVKK